VISYIFSCYSYYIYHYSFAL